MTIQLRRDTAANWSSVNPVLADGQPGYDKTNNQLRVGDGTTTWSSLPSFGGTGVTDGDKGDVTVSGVGTTWTIDNGVVTVSKMANANANSLLGNNTGSAATPAWLTVSQVKTLLNYTTADISGLTAALDAKADDSQFSAFGLTLVDDADASAARTTLGLGNSAVLNTGTTAGTVATGDHTHSNATTSVAGFMSASDKTKLDGVATSANNYVHPNHTGDVTSTGDGATSIANDVVTNSKLANMAANTVKGNNTGASADPKDLTVSEVKTLLAYTPGDIGAATSGHTHSDATTSVAGFMSASDKTKLDGVATGATANSSDATLLSRANHTGTQTASTISDFSEAVDDRVSSLLVAGTNVTLTYNDGANTLTIDATGGGGGISDGDKGDITVSGSGTTWTIDNGVVSLAKQADVATSTVFYRKTAGTGSPEVQTLATLKTDLGLTGTNSGDQTSIVGITGTKAQFDTAVTDGNFLYVGDVTSNATHTGDVTGATALTIANDVVTNSKLANMAANTLKGNNTGGSADPADLTVAQVKTLLAYTAADVGAATSGHTHSDATTSVAGFMSASDKTKLDGIEASADANVPTDLSYTASTRVLASSTGADATLPLFTSTEAGLVPLSGGGTTNYLRADGTWAAPAGGGGVSDGDKGDITVSGSGATWTIDNGAVTLAKMANVSTAVILGRVTAGTGVPEALTGTQATTLLDTFTTSLKGLAPASGGGTTNFLRADGTWVAPPGAGTAEEVTDIVPSAQTDDDYSLVLRDDGTPTLELVKSPFIKSFIQQRADRTLTNSTSVQQIFDETTNGRLTLPTGFYKFEAGLYLTTMNATSGNFSFRLLGSGTATLANILYFSSGVDNNSPLTNTTKTGSAAVTQNSTTNILAAATGTGATVNLEGVFAVTAAGTIIPSLALTTANAAILKSGSYFIIERVGPHNVDFVGSWD